MDIPKPEDYENEEYYAETSLKEWDGEELEDFLDDELFCPGCGMDDDYIIFKNNVGDSVFLCHCGFRKILLEEE